MSKIQVVVGGQFGSEGKGHCAAELAKYEPDLLAIRTGGPNAGHTAWANGVEYKLRQLPVAAVVNPEATIALAAGSLVDLDVLDIELHQTGRKVAIDRSATILEPKHIQDEQNDPDMQWGSTKKGIGAARADRIHRTAMVWGEGHRGRTFGTDVAELARQHLELGGTVQIEAAQGYGLGLHTPFYPKTTSANCRAVDALADVGLNVWEFPNLTLEIWVVIRPNPIRVAGDSGPLKGETSWEELGLPEERTTVTNKVRRVGEWDPELVRQAVAANGGGARSRGLVQLWLNMADQIAPELAGATQWEDFSRLERTHPDQWRRLTEFSNRTYHETGGFIAGLGTGPATAIWRA